MNKIGYLVVSIVISLFIHVIAFSSLGKLELGIFSVLEQVSKKPKQDMKVTMLDSMHDILQDSSEDQLDVADQLRNQIQTNRKVIDLFKDEGLIKPPKPKLTLNRLNKRSVPKPENNLPPQMAAAPRPEIMAIDAGELSTARLQVEDRTMVANVARKNINKKYVPSLIHAPSVRAAGQDSHGVSMRMSLPPGSPLNLGKAPTYVGGDGTRGGFNGGFNPHAPIPGLPGYNGAGGAYSKGAIVKQLDKLMTVRMLVDYAADGSGYFKMSILPNMQSQKMRAVSKDVMFLIDCSNSISTAKLAQFKSATSEALQYLNRGDRFNVVSFNNRPNALFPAPVKVTDKSLQLAKEFTKKIMRGGMTDLFAGLSPFVDIKNSKDDTNRPMNIFLMSDGKSTVKDSLKNDKMLREILRLNRTNVSLFSFSAGKNVNQFLMQFLAYHNRGMSYHEHKLRDFNAKLVKFITAHSDLIVSDLKYTLSGGLASDIYPRRLQHLYRGTALNVYGRFSAGSDDVAVSIIGKNAQGEFEELIYKTKLSECARSNRKLGKIWHAQKLFHLVSLRIINSTKELEAQIQKIAKKYNIAVPN